MFLLDEVVAVDGAEDQEEDHRQEEGEERGLAIAPEEQLLDAQLVQPESHPPSSAPRSWSAAQTGARAKLCPEGVACDAV